MAARRHSDEDLETYLDYLAGLMQRMGRRAHKAVPLYQVVEAELERRRAEAATLAAARERVRRLSDRRAALS